MKATGRRVKRIVEVARVLSRTHHTRAGQDGRMSAAIAPLSCCLTPGVQFIRLLQNRKERGSTVFGKVEHESRTGLEDRSSVGGIALLASGYPMVLFVRQAPDLSMMFILDLSTHHKLRPAIVSCRPSRITVTAIGQVRCGVIAAAVPHGGLAGSSDSNLNSAERAIHQRIGR